jgi:hypothetical protein
MVSYASIVPLFLYFKFYFGTLHTLFYAAHKKRTKKRTKWIDLIFE